MAIVPLIPQNVVFLQPKGYKTYIAFKKSMINFKANKMLSPWEDISDRNKFIMDIGDEELAEYIKNSQRSGISISKRDLMGQWERKASGYEDYYYEFLENDSFCRKVISHYANPFYNGEIILTYKHSGKWSLKDDTLFMVNAPKSIEVGMDTSRITYRPEMRDSVKRIIRELNISTWKESLQKSLERNRIDTTSHYDQQGT